MTAGVTQPLSGISGDVFRAAFRRHAAGVAVVTADAGDGPRGMTATSLASISLQPPLVSFAIATTASAWPTFASADRVAVHLLGHEQSALASRFATSGIDRFAEPTRWEYVDGTIPVLSDAPTVLLATISDRLVAGDHRVIVAHVIEVLDRHDAEPLVYHDGGYRTLASADPR
jgi:flavin reductase (DIM6/NTAB) family NADH-FMN oxidoreductase RutF